MRDQAERIHAALLRFKGMEPDVKAQQTAPDTAARQLVVVDEKNLAALSVPNDLSNGKAAVRGAAEGD